MPFLKKLIAIGCAICLTSSAAMAADCGNTSAGFEAWKANFAKQAQRAGVGKRGLQALAATRYSSTTISADRNQKSFRYTLSKFMQIRGSATIEAQGRKRLARNPEFYQALEKRYGVPAGVLLAIHGMETGFGGFMGDTPVVSAITTLAYDCRRSDFFKPHAIGALKLVDQARSPAQHLAPNMASWAIPNSCRAMPLNTGSMPRATGAWICTIWPMRWRPPRIFCARRAGNAAKAIKKDSQISA